MSATKIPLARVLTHEPTTSSLVPRRPRVARLASLFVPSLALLIIMASATWFASDASRQTGYWEMQVDAFLTLNASLAQWPVPWAMITELGDALIMLVLLSPLLLRRPDAWLALVAAVPVATILTRTGKEWLSVPRPGAVLDATDLIVMGERLSGMNSFPSGHTTTVVVAGTVLWLALSAERPSRSRAMLRVALVAIVATAALSRVAVGAHWPLDVLAGSICGYLGGASGIALIRRFPTCVRWHLNARIRRSIGWVVITLCWLLAIRTVETGAEASQLAIPTLFTGLAAAGQLMSCTRPLLVRNAVTQS